MKTFIVILIIFQVHAETLNFKQIFQTPKHRDYDKLEILERSSFGTADDDDNKNGPTPQPINDKTKASANAQISLRFGQEKILPCGCRQPSNLPPPYPYLPPPCCCAYAYPPLMYPYSYPSAPLPSPGIQSKLEEVICDLGKVVSALARQTKPVPIEEVKDAVEPVVEKVVDKVADKVADEVVEEIIDTATDAKDETAPDVIEATLAEDPAPVAEQPEPIAAEELPKLPLIPEPNVKYLKITVPCPKVDEPPVTVIKDPIRNALVPHFSPGRSDLLLSYPIFKPNNHQYYTKTASSEAQFSDPTKTVIIKEPTVTHQYESVIVPLDDMTIDKTVQRPLPLPFPDPAYALPAVLPEYVRITKPVIVPKPIVPTLPQIILPPTGQHVTDCSCQCCTRYTKELNE